jgi:hypothetical protein
MFDGTQVFTDNLDLQEARRKLRELVEAGFANSRIETTSEPVDVRICRTSSPVTGRRRAPR